jgi:hypothetical protein
MVTRVVFHSKKVRRWSWPSWVAALTLSSVGPIAIVSVQYSRTQRVSLYGTSVEKYNADGTVQFAEPE